MLESFSLEHRVGHNCVCGRKINKNYACSRVFHLSIACNVMRTYVEEGGKIYINQVM